MDDERDYAAMIGDELANADAMRDSTPETVGVLRIKTANETLSEAQRRPDPTPL